MEDKPKIQVEDDWMIRPCQMYQDAFSDCRRIKARFHQYFVFGSFTDCSQWCRDYDNCIRCIKGGKEDACQAVIQSEKERHRKRIETHLRNDVWEKRKVPPQNWNMPLPEKMQEAYKNSYLETKSKEMQDDPDKSSSGVTCVIS